MKRVIELVVISDVHLGTYGCHAKELALYLKEIQPEILILNGDIIDIWQFNKRYFPIEHLQVINRILKMASNGTKVYYITGNHDEKLRQFAPLKVANIELCNQLELILRGQKYWFFHGDVFDASVNYSKWFAKLGGWSYDFLIRLNKSINVMRAYLGYEKTSFSQKVKYGVKEAVKFIQNFEEIALETALKKEVDYVVCGHIHRPIIKNEEHKGKNITYLNSGDWVEHLTSLEFDEGVWSIYKFDEEAHVKPNVKLIVKEPKSKAKVNDEDELVLEKQFLAAFNF